MSEEQPALLGAYGSWIRGLTSAEVPGYSFLDPRWSDAATWSGKAREIFAAAILAPKIPKITVRTTGRKAFDGLVFEELAWDLPFGPTTRAWFLRPEKARGRLPGVLALHDHGANKYFGKSKIAGADENTHNYIENYRRLYYGGRAWANELAKRGYGVLVHDIFPFESRRIIPSELPGFVVERMMQRPEELRELSPEDLASDRPCRDYEVSGRETVPEIERYNAFAGQHEAIIAKVLFSAGTSWPGLVLAEDVAALDYLASRPDIDPERVGCGGLSGGGLRTNYLAGSDSRIRCSVTAGFMTTWADFAMRTAYTHTWMIYIPGLPRHLDFPDILAMRAPLPALVQCTRQDPLFDQDEVRRAEAVLSDTYRKAGAPGNFRMSWYDGAHKFDLSMQEEAFGWFDTWL
ncbi:MAG: prolyl oligopeptidase family serine peptidase [Spirochaetota bacterium]